jgi:N-methylhydantoinase A
MSGRFSPTSGRAAQVGLIIMASAGAFSLGIDIGGTFTDVVLFDEVQGHYFSHKQLTTPADPTEGVIEGVRHLFAREQLKFEDVSRVVHATTLFTNALIERKGAVTGLITTEGFGDILEIAREQKYELYDIFVELPKPLVPSPLRKEVPERVSPAGAIETPLDCEALVARAEELAVAGVQSIAVIFLHAYVNPAQERLARDVLAARFPNVFISISSDVSPQIREYERASTTAANAYIKPLAATYLSRLESQLKTLGIGAELFLMLSNGGFTNVAEVRRNPVQMMESGPAAGVLAGAYFGSRSARPDVIAFDMGGTTAKLSVIQEATPHVVYRFEASRQKRFIEGSGLPLNISTVELIEIGAGGGSIAHMDELGLLKVGPQSAGAVPGPACYLRGGKALTVTDANLLLGYLDPDYFAGGTMPINLAAATAAAATLAEDAGLDVTRTAWGVYDLVNEAMASAARVHVSERGYDPRRYALLTTGGGGPLHGCEVAQKLGIETIVCPPSAGVASALGLLMAPTRIDRVLTFNRPLDGLDVAALEARFAEIEAEAGAIVAETGIAPGLATVQRFADMRYLGQGFELVVALPSGPYTQASCAGILAAFETAYRRIYSRTLPNGKAEIVNVRVCLQAPAGASRLAPRMPGEGRGDAACKGTRPAYFGSAKGFVEASIYDRGRLIPDVEIRGPALIEEPESTLLLPPAAVARVEANGNIVVTLR